MNAPSALHRALVIVGGGALLAAMATDAVAVLGRHLGVPLRGSIELVAGVAGLWVATREAVHATVHLLVDRLPEQLRDPVRRAGLALGALLFAALCAASAWIAADLWRGHEESEWLRLPWRPLRVLAVLGCAAVAASFAGQALRRRRP